MAVFAAEKTQQRTPAQPKKRTAPVWPKRIAEKEDCHPLSLLRQTYLAMSSPIQSSADETAPNWKRGGVASIQLHRNVFLDCCWIAWNSFTSLPQTAKRFLFRHVTNGRLVLKRGDGHEEGTKLFSWRENDLPRSRKLESSSINSK